jgi:hypothetical protein
MPITNRFLEPEAKDVSRRDEIQNYTIDFDQNYDRRTGNPIGRPVLNNITISITRDSEDSEPFYIDWQTQPTKRHTLKICFYDTDNLKRTITITDAFLVGYTQSSSAPGEVEEHLVLSPASVDVDGILFTRANYL